MGLKCSLLGHRFGDPDVEREREERGSEVVTTTREVAVCERCEEKRVLSENKEVTAIVDESEIGGDSGTDQDTAAGPGGQPDDEPEPDGDDLVSEAVKNVQAERDASGGMADIDVPEEDEGAEIMSDDADETRERGYGEWPAEPGEEPEPWDSDATDAADPGPAGSARSDPAGVDERRDDSQAGGGAASADQRPFGTGKAEDVTPDTGAEIIDGGPGSSGHQRDATGDSGRDDGTPVDTDAPRTNAASERTGDDGAGGSGGGGSDGSDIIDAEDHQSDEPAAGASPASSRGNDDAGSSGSGAPGGGGASGGAAGDGAEGGGAAGGDTGDDLIDAEVAAESEGSGDEAGPGSGPSFEETEAASPSRPDAYECPECGFETMATNSPLRAGDPCPECSAYLVGSERKN